MQTLTPAQLNLSASLRKSLAAGETFLVADGSHPIAFLVSAPTAPRPTGLCRGEFELPDDFNAPSPDIEGLFYGEP